MMSNSNKLKADFLGMPYGTASARLKKLLMFKFAQELGYDVCFACGEKIESAEELSVEHKEPWLNRENGIEKFWDLDNIAFSHLSCNKPHLYNGSGKHSRKVGPEGTAWCYKHKKFIATELFHIDNSRWNGLCNICKDCDTDRESKIAKAKRKQ